LRDVDLVHNTNLSSIHIRRLAFGDSDDSVMHQVVPALLSQITSYDLREVIMDVPGGTLEDLGKIDWNSIARILQQPKFSGFEKLIIYGIADDLEKGRYWMMRWLPPGRARDKFILCELLIV
jgi:hypothetical protein